LVGHFWKPKKGQAVGGEWNVMNMIDGTEEQAAIQLVMSSWLMKIFKGYVTRRKGHKSGFGDHVNRERC
jgi:hypothetical protein